MTITRRPNYGGTLTLVFTDIKSALDAMKPGDVLTFEEADQSNASR